MASSDVLRPSNLIQQAPYIHHPSILYGNPPGIASGPFVSPVLVVPAVVAPPLQTQLHHGCGMMVSHATPNGNLVNCQNNMESQGGCVQWVCLVTGEGVSVPVRASYPGTYVKTCEECRRVEDYNAECVNWSCECVRICQVCKRIMIMMWAYQGLLVCWCCVTVFAGVCQGVSVCCVVRQCLLGYVGVSVSCGVCQCLLWYVKTLTPPDIPQQTLIHTTRH